MSPAARPKPNQTQCSIQPSSYQLGLPLPPPQPGAGGRGVGGARGQWAVGVDSEAPDLREPPHHREVAAPPLPRQQALQGSEGSRQDVTHAKGSGTRLFIRDRLRAVLAGQCKGRRGEGGGRSAGGGQEEDAQSWRGPASHGQRWGRQKQ